MLTNESLDAKNGVDTAENEPRKGSKKYMLERTPLEILDDRMKQSLKLTCPSPFSAAREKRFW